MRLTEETDAIRTLGLSPMQVLVVPRVLALVLALPLLVFVGDVMSLLGAMAIAGPMLDITPAMFLARLREALDLRHVLVGLAKAPVFALRHRRHRRAHGHDGGTRHARARRGHHLDRGAEHRRGDPARRRLRGAAAGARDMTAALSGRRRAAR
jgi:hypothetical protein